MAKPMNNISMAFNLEGYPNRDSTKYIDLYGLHDFSTVVRGTLRYRGFAFLMAAMKEIGLFNNVDNNLPGVNNFYELLCFLTKDTTVDFSENYDNSVKDSLRELS